MEDARVAVVGGGVTGLTSAYRLSEKGADVKIFEKDIILGGRASKTNQLIPPEHKDLLDFFQEIGIEDEVLEPLEFSEMVSLVDGDINSFEPFTLFLKPEEDLSFVEKYVKRPLFSRLMGVDVDGVKELKQAVRSVEFDYEGGNNEASRLHDMPSDEWINQFPENTQENVIYPTLQTMYLNDFSEVSAECVAHHIKEFVESASGQFKEVAGGPVEVTRSIKEKCDASIEMNAEIKNVDEHSEGLDLVYEKNGEERTEGFDFVLLATPTPSIEDIVGISFEIEYEPTEAVTIDGETRKEFVNLIGADKDTNIRSVFSPEGECFAYPKKKGEEMDLSQVFKEGYEVLGTEETLAHPKIPPGAEIPELQQTDRIFIAGDFYRFSGLNTAVYTGEKAADLIEKQYNQ
ncbi:MAG: FAD-dependent oxidoreductase [Candidatus Nanohalobium sp.]